MKDNKQQYGSETFREMEGMSQDRTYDTNPQSETRPGLSRGMKIYLGIAIPLLVLVIAALVYVIFFVKPPESTPYGMSSQTAASTTTEATTTATTMSEEEQITVALAELNGAAEEIQAPEMGYGDNPRREGVYTVLVLGLDASEKLSDTMMMLTLDTQKKDVRIMSIPRDLMSTSVFGNVIKINAAYAQGIEETITEVANVLGYTPNRYVTLDYDAFERLIDAIGGVEMDVFMDMKYDDYAGKLHIDLKEGPQLLDGEKALHYVRFRSGYAAADIKRIEIGQEFFAAVIKKLASPSTILRVPELANVFRDCVKTDMSLGEIIWLTLQYYDMDPDDIHWGKVPTHSVVYEGQSYEAAYEGTLIRRINEGKYNPYKNAIDVVNLTLPPEETTAAAAVNG